MFGRKNKMSADRNVGAKSVNETNESSNLSNCGGRCSSSKASDMTSGSKSTKSCGGKCSKTNTSNSKNSTSKARTTKSSTKSCS